VNQNENIIVAYTAFSMLAAGSAGHNSLSSGLVIASSIPSAWNRR
jgi:hypothetical protein